MNDSRSLLDQVCAKAVACRSCFDDGIVEPAQVDLAQPRWVGPRYFDSDLRVLVMLINPGSGRNVKISNEKYIAHLKAYGRLNLSLDELFGHQKEDMGNWRRFLPFYGEGLGLNLEEAAFANVAWCASKGNRYPREMLLRCFSLHTVEAVNILRPDFLILSGGKVQEFWAQWKKSEGSRKVRVWEVPEVHSLLHFAHREGGKRGGVELARVKEAIQEARRRRTSTSSGRLTPHAEAP